MTTPTQTAQRTAIIFLDGVSRSLLMAQDTGLPSEERLEAGSRAWNAWAYACQAMAELETLMPRSAEAGYARNAEIAEWREKNPKSGASA